MKSTPFLGKWDRWEGNADIMLFMCLTNHKQLKNSNIYG